MTKINSMMFASSILFFALAAVAGYAEFTIFWFITALVVDALYEFIKWMFSNKELEYVPIPKVSVFYVLLALFSPSNFSFIWLGLAIVLDAWRFIWRLAKSFL